MRIGRGRHLTYCSNIHAGESWAEVDRNLRLYLPQVREKLHHTGSFGVGLRLSAEAAVTLETPAVLAQFKSFLHEQSFYVFTINGFPYGTFHGQRVKEDVYLPDWKDPLRLEYTNRLARLLAELLPEGIQGSVSTAPGAFKANVRSAADVQRISSNLREHARFLGDLKARTGKTITLAIEPEPCCHIETVAEAIRFFDDELGDPAVREHIGLCFDACHMAVEFEDPADALVRLKAAGIPIYKFQISSALRLRFREAAAAREALEPFAESTYLHQVVENDGSSLRRYVDLPEAFRSTTNDGDREWRVHFHVPLFMKETAEGLSTTQNYLIDLFRILREKPDCPYLEVETYTWDVLPPAFRNVDIATAVARELEWVVKQLSDE